MAKSHPRQQSRASGKPARTVTTPDWPVLAPAVLGMLLTAYLWALAWGAETAAFCAPDSGCDVIQQSHYSTVLGWPLALWGFLVYAMIALLAYRPATRLQRWKRLWAVALFGVVISVYLTVVGKVQLDAFCAWCLASLATMSAIFITVAVRRPPSAPAMNSASWLVNNVGAALAVIAALHVYYHHDTLLPDDPRLEPLAIHLNESGAEYYGAYWCDNCQRQNREFGDAKEHLPYTECSPAGRGGPLAPECERQGISAFPTWIIGGQRYEGLLTPRELAEYSGFSWDEARLTSGRSADDE